MSYILAIDQGTTSSRAILFDKDMKPVASAQQEFEQHFPASGWVEHNPDDLWQTVQSTCKNCLHDAGIGPDQVSGIGITNQRETTLVWDVHTGEPLYNAIVWQDRRTADICADLKQAGHEAMVSAQTGLLLDPYFSGTKLKWILDQSPDARARARNGDILFGTVDTFLIWKLTGGKRHVTDATNAARTLLFDIHKGAWSAEICDLLDIPAMMLPEVLDCAADFGTTSFLGPDIPVLGVAGDQQAATIGQACFEPGMLKSTYGTGCFALLNTGHRAIPSRNRLLTTIAYQLDGQRTYALEGSIFIAGAVVQWLRDKLGIVANATETAAMAHAGRDGVTLVPAFTGFGAPYWKPESRGAVFGLTRDTSREDMVRAALQSIGFQTSDLWEAMKADWPEASDAVLRVDGGLSANDWAMQFLADVLDAPVDRPKGVETTALGAAWLAGMRAGLYPDMDGFARNWAKEHQFLPGMDDQTRQAHLDTWRRAVSATLSV